MKTPSISLLVLFIASMACADDAPEFRNGDFENGKQFWKGNGKAVTEKEGGNKVWELKASERNGDEITQDIDLGKLTKVEITLRAKGVEYKGAGLRVSVKKRGGGSLIYTLGVTEGEWKNLKFTYNRNDAESEYSVILTPMMGKGSIQIDDIKVDVATTAPKPQ